MFNNYSKFYDLFNEDKPYKKEIEFIYKWANRPREIIDIGCGTANYWRYYPKKINIVGIDKSREMMSGSSEIICADVTTYNFPFFPVFDCATALFDVLNYIPRHDWWKKIPVKKGGYFIFDIWNKKKIDKEGFNATAKLVGGVFRHITPVHYDGKSVNLKIFVATDDLSFTEHHKMYLYSDKDIKKFCGKEFKIVDIKDTRKWQRWYKLKRK